MWLRDGDLKSYQHISSFPVSDEGRVGGVKNNYGVVYTFRCIKMTLETRIDMVYG